MQLWLRMQLKKNQKRIPDYSGVFFTEPRGRFFWFDFSPAFLVWAKARRTVPLVPPYQYEGRFLQLISIKTFGYLSRYITGKEMDYYDFENGISVKDIVHKLHIPDAAVGFVSVNGSMVDMNYQIAQGDQIKIYPVVMGG